MDRAEVASCSQQQRWSLFLIFCLPRQKEIEPNFVPVDIGLQEADNRLHQNLNRQFQAALPFLFRPGTQTMARAERERQRGRERRRKSARLRQMPYSSHRGYFVTSKWPFGFLRPRMLMCPQELIARSKEGILDPTEH